MLKRPEDDLDGNFIVVRRVIDPDEGTLAVEDYESSSVE